jgi:diguanylate cyclase (GGDEF)-like protein
MLFASMHRRAAPISDAVYIEVVIALHGTIVPILMAGVGQAIVGAIAARETGDRAIALLTILGVVVAIIRMFGVLAFRRRMARKPLLARAEAFACEWRYAAGTVVTGLIIGAFAARSLVLKDAICSVMAIGMAFGFGAGVVARLSLRPVVAMLDLTAIGLPAIMTLFLQPWDAPHIALGLFFSIFVVGSFEMVRLSYNSTLNQMTLKRQFEQLARTDPMTGLSNRSVLATDLVQIVADRGSRMVAVHAIDLDHFKAANDRYGHPVGDALLRQVAARLMAVADPADLIVRMGGDEFILVQRQVRSRDDAELTAQRILEKISAPYQVDGHEIVIGASIGIAVAPEHGKTVEALLCRSDAALYRVKERRGGYAFAAEPAPADESRENQRAA